MVLRTKPAAPGIEASSRRGGAEDAVTGAGVALTRSASAPVRRPTARVVAPHPALSAARGQTSAMASLPVLTTLPVAALGALVLLSVLAPDTAQALALPIAVTGGVIGIPHGAVDHLVPWWWSTQTGPAPRRHPGPLRLTGFVLAYAASAALAFGASLVIPTATYVAFLALSALHFGRGEAVTTAERAGRAVPGPGEEWPTTVASGLVVIGLLLWARPHDTAELLRPVSPWLADAVVGSAAVGLVVVGVSVVAAVAVQLRRRRFLDAAELALLTVAFAVAPPLAAFGLWFGLWHAVRHTGRLLDLARTDPDVPATSLDWWRAVRVGRGRSPADPRRAGRGGGAPGGARGCRAAGRDRRAPGPHLPARRRRGGARPAAVEGRVAPRRRRVPRPVPSVAQAHHSERLDPCEVTCCAGRAVSGPYGAPNGALGATSRVGEIRSGGGSAPGRS